MNWYVKHGGTEEISGPMTKEEALSKADQADGMIFSENIFPPKFVTTPEVEGLLHELKGIRESLEIIREGEDDAVGLVMKQAIDTITFLSVEQVPGVTRLPRSVEELLGDLHGVKNRVEDHVSGRVVQVVGRAIDTITLLSRPKVVTGSIREGVLTLKEVSEGVSVDIRDYDVRAEMRLGKSVLLHDPELLKTDKDGNTYFEINADFSS